jgi:hypothetical protein
VRAGIVADPKDYRWSGYGEACGGGRLARAGLAAVHGSRWTEQPGDWRHVARRYRVLLYTSGGERREAYGDRIVRPGIAAAEAERVIESGGRLTLQQALRCRVRYFTDGMAVGGKAFVDGVFESNSGFSAEAQTARARCARRLGGLRVGAGR